MRELDPATIRRAQDGDTGAFEGLVRMYQADAWRFAFHLTRDRTLADDATQEAFLRAFRSLRTYRGGSPFGAWLMRIVHNCAVDAQRKAWRERAVLGRAVAAGGPAVIGVPTEDRVRIDQAIESLPWKLRSAFVLVEILGYAYREASAILAVPGGTVKSRVHRARIALIERLSLEEAAGEV